MSVPNGDSDKNKPTATSRNQSEETSFWNNPPEWVEKLEEEENAKIIPAGKKSQSAAISYVSLRTNNEIAFSIRAMQEYFAGIDAVGLAVKSPSGGGAKKLYIRPLEKPETIPFGGQIKRSESGSGKVNVGKAFEYYDLQPEQSEKYPLKWNKDLGVAIANLNTQPINNK